jgi:chromosome segregation ATPase
VAELKEMRQTLNQREDSLAVFRGAISERLGPVGHNVDGGPFNEDIEVLVQRLANLKARTISPAQQEALKGVARTLADLKASVGRLDGRLKKKDRKLNELMTRTDHALERIRTVRRTADALLSRAESELDELALAYVEEQDHRMAFALDRTEQQIAHLYEYLALENLERGQP